MCDGGNQLKVPVASIHSLIKPISRTFYFTQLVFPKISTIRGRDIRVIWEGTPSGVGSGVGCWVFYIIKSKISMAFLDVITERSAGLPHFGRWSKEMRVRVLLEQIQEVHATLLSCELLSSASIY